MVLIPKRGKDLFLKAHHVENGDLVVVTAPAYVLDGKFGERTVVNVTVKRTGEAFRWALNGTTSDRCSEAWSSDGDLWENKVLKVQKVRDVVAGEERSVLYGVPFKEPVLAWVKSVPRRKACRSCADARVVCTGSQIFYLCSKTGRYRSIADVCDQC